LLSETPWTASKGRTHDRKRPRRLLKGTNQTELPSNATD
jgi:hypothetical protein